MRQPKIVLNMLRKQFPKVERVVDARTPIRVTIKAADCKAAVGGSFNECALARATKREFKADGCMIGLTISYVVRGKLATRYSTPVSVAREMVSFDRHHDFDQGTYHLAPVAPTNRLGVYKRKKGGTGKPRNLRPHKMHHSARVRRMKEIA